MKTAIIATLALALFVVTGLTACKKAADHMNSPSQPQQENTEATFGTKVGEIRKNVWVYTFEVGPKHCVVVDGAQNDVALHCTVDAQDGRAEPETRTGRYGY